jgi:tetratricopeptide (TPR) repeat protein
VLLVAAAVAFGSAAAAAPKPEEQVRDAVVSAMKAGFEKGDLAGYMAAWDENARLIAGRGPKPGPHDAGMDRSAIEATKRLVFGSPLLAGVRVSHDDVNVQVKGDEAEVTLKTTTSRTVEGTPLAEVVGERFLLKKREDGWRIVENRYWPIEMRVGGDTFTYDEQAWTRLDAAAEQTGAMGDVSGQLGALLQGWRFRDAYEAAKRRTKEDKKNLSAWMALATAARLVGKADEALAAYRAVHRLDPKAPVPDAAR